MHPDRYEAVDILFEERNYLEDQAWGMQKTEHVALKESVAAAKNYPKHICFVLKLGKLALLRSNRFL